MNNLQKKIERFFRLLKMYCRIKFKERKFKNILNYYFIDNHAETLMIVFSAFTGDVRRYNYIKGLDSYKIDKLYILDPFGYKGSYNLYENGKNQPEKLTFDLINSIINKNNYKYVYTAGSSKGGTCAIYFGLGIKANIIFSGACQYYIGNYVRFNHEREPIFIGMMGEYAGVKEQEILNSLLPKQIEYNKNSKSIIHMVYSKNELTYERHIKDLLDKLSECNIKYVENIESFTNHSDIGVFFLNYLRKTLNSMNFNK